jgi:hypothetical protein
MSQVVARIRASAKPYRGPKRKFTLKSGSIWSPTQYLRVEPTADQGSIHRSPAETIAIAAREPVRMPSVIRPNQRTIVHSGQD